MSCPTASRERALLSAQRHAFPIFGERGPCPGTFLKHRSAVSPSAVTRAGDSTSCTAQMKPP